MWEVIEPHFSRFPAQAKVAKAIVNIGLAVKDGAIHCAGIEMSISAIARTLKVDRRIVTNTIHSIEADPKLRAIFAALEPTVVLRHVAPLMGWSVLELHLSDANSPGLLGKIASELGRVGVSIRQAVGEDPQYSEGKLFIVAENEVPAEAIVNIRRIQGVTKVII